MLIRTLTAAALTLLVAGSALAEGAADPQSNPHLIKAAAATEAFARMDGGYAGHVAVVSTTAGRASTLEAINAAR